MAQAAVKIEPKGEWLSIMAIAKRCGIHRQTCTSRLEDLGYEPDEERSTPKNQVYWFDDEMEFAIKAAKDSLSAAKIRDLRASTELKELKLAEARKELVPMHEATELVQRIVSTIYQEYTIRQPKRIGTKLAKAKSPAAVKVILKADSDRIMKMVKDNFEKFIEQ
jgi:hypothetical protein